MKLLGLPRPVQTDDPDQFANSAARLEKLRKSEVSFQDTEARIAVNSARATSEWIVPAFLESQSSLGLHQVVAICGSA